MNTFEKEKCQTDREVLLATYNCFGVFYLLIPFSIFPSLLQRYLFSDDFYRHKVRTTCHSRDITAIAHHDLINS